MCARRALIDLIAIAAATGVAVASGLAADTAVPAAATVRAVHTATAIAAVAAATTGALAVVRARLVGDARMTHLGLALLVYGIAVVPSTPDGAAASGDVAFGSLRVAAVVSVLVLLALGLRSPEVDSGQSLPRLAVLTVLTAGCVAAVLSGSGDLIPDALSRTAIPLVWGAVAVAYLTLGVRTRRQSFWRVGLGLAVIAGALLVGSAVSSGRPPVNVSAVRMVGVVVLLAGVAPDVRAAFAAWRRGHDLIRQRWLHAEDQARTASESVAERDHEIRNALAGLSGVTYALGRPSGALDRRGVELLGRAAHAEFERLKVLVSGENCPPAADFDVRELLLPLIFAEQQQGRPVHLEAPTGLFAHGRPAALRQIVVNLLTNCAKHAPGALVVVTAGERAGRLVVTVSDNGPGLSEQEASAVVVRGVRCGEADGGSGLGLYVSARLAAEQGGSLRLLGRRSGVTGCTVVVELPMEQRGPASVPAQRGATSARPA